MVVKSPELIWTDIFFNEHNQLLQQSSQVCEMLTQQINSLGIEIRDRKTKINFIEEIVSWKADFKKVLWGLWIHLKDHVERETAFLDSFTERGLEPLELKRNEAVLEHLDEMNWLINNTPARQMPIMLGYIQQKKAELCQGVSEHCERSNQILKQFAEEE
jgi:hypothetical protein